MAHVPCRVCPSSDAGWVFEDGGFYCYSCGHHDQSGVTGDVNIPPSDRKKSVQFVEVDSFGVPKRGISEETGKKWGYGYGTHKGKRVQVASYRDDKGRIVAQKLRYPNKEFTIIGDMTTAGLYGQRLWKGVGGRSLVVTEGEIDALTVAQVMENKWPVVSIPNGAQAAAGAFKKNLEFLQSFDRVVIMFDMDEPGQEAALECAALLPPGRAYIANLPMKDANELLKANRSVDIMTAYWNAAQFRPDGLITGDKLLDYLKKATLAPAVPYPWKSLTDFYRGGSRRGEVTMVVAGTGSGKSTAIKEMEWNMIAEGVPKIGIAALEEDVGETLWGILGVAMNKRLTLETDQEVLFSKENMERFDQIKNRVVVYDHWGSTDTDNLLAKLRFMAKGEDCHFIFLDHISIVVSGMDIEESERRTIDVLMTKLASLAKECNVGIIAVCHLKKPDRGETHEEGRPVTLDDLRGSGALKQLVWNVISLERNQQDPATSHIVTVRGLKSRKIGKTGVACTLAWDENTGRLTEIDTVMFAEPEEVVEAGKEFE